METTTRNYDEIAAKFDAMVEANAAATGLKYITSNEIKGLMAEYTLGPGMVRAVWGKTKYPNTPKTSCQQPAALRDAIGLLKAGNGKLSPENLELLRGSHPSMNEIAISGVVRCGKALLAGRDDEEESPVVAEIPGMVDVKAMLAQYEKARLKVSKCRETFDAAQIALTEAENEMERYKPLAKQIENLQALATRLKNGEA